MTRGTPEYIEAVQRVKIDFFTEHLGLDINGILHAGTNDGYEMQFYRDMGIERLAGVEPLPSAIALFRKKYPWILLFEYALSDHSGKSPLTVVLPGDGQGSSLHAEVSPHPEYDYSTTIEVQAIRGDALPLPWDLYNCLVMDVQGHELQALRGFGERLRGFQMLSVECSIEPVYHGGATAAEVEAYLDSMGFERRSPLEEHTDVFFTRRQ